jgi:hypothetical protein
MTAVIPVGDGQVVGLSDADYHADRSSLSASGAKLLLSPGGPARFREAMDRPPTPKREFDFGHAAHKLLLGEGAEIVAVDAKDWRTKAAQDQRKAAHAENKIPLLVGEVDKAEQMAAMVHSHPVAGPLFAEGRAETSLYVTDPESGVRLRARPDWMTVRDGRLWIVDFKTVADGGAHEDVFARKAHDFGYHVQAAVYVTVARLLGLHASPAFVFVVAEKAAPCLVNVIELDAEYFDIGLSDMRRAVEMFRDCTDSGMWPGYRPKVHSVSAPPWAGRQASIGELMEA